jgi:hypothetical protein
MKPLIILFYLLTGVDASVDVADPIGTVTYKINGEEKTVSLRSLSVSLKSETTGDPGKENTYSVASFTIYDTPNNKTFRFTIHEDKVVSGLKGEYPLRASNEIEFGKSTGIMVINPQNTTQMWLSTIGGSCQVELSGTTLKVKITDANLAIADETVPFEFTLNATGVKVRN